MTRDDIIRMAREVWFAGEVYIGPSTEPLERFAALVAKHEREACANVCDEIEKRKWQAVMHGGEMQGIGARDCAAAIRERGVK
jgi:hypothetical protein